jgi:23S rRNA pseudouridine1911/1915/1917 synthase
VHLDALSHRIVGDPIYGLNENFVDDFLNDKVEKSERIKTTGASRLMLHAYYLEFTFLNTIYVFCSKQVFCDEVGSFHQRTSCIAKGHPYTCKET